jgi:hypothetical protein
VAPFGGAFLHSFLKRGGAENAERGRGMLFLVGRGLDCFFGWIPGVVWRHLRWGNADGDVGGPGG